MVPEVATLATCVHSLQRELESLRTEQAREQCMMGEILSLLQALASTKPPPAPVADCGVQTSPHPWETLCLVSEKTRYFQSLQLTTGPAPQPRGETGFLGPPQPTDQEPGRTSDANLPAVALTEPERAEALADRMTEPYRTRSAAAYTPGAQEGAASAWTQETTASCSQSGAKLENLGVLAEADGGVRRTAGVPKQAGRQKRGIQRGHRARLPRRRRKALPLRGGQGNSGRGKMPAPTSCQSPANTPENAGACFNPCGGWSQESSGTQFVSGCETTTASWVIPLSEAKTGITQKGFWQLFDFCDDSD